jgi:hypothetical protein
VWPLRVEPNRAFDLRFGPHHAVHAHLAACRRGWRALNVPLDRELVRQGALACLTPHGRVQPAPLVRLSVAGQAGLAGALGGATWECALCISQNIKRREKEMLV